MPKNRKGAPAQAVAGRNWYELRARARSTTNALQAAQEEREAEIYITGDIGERWWDEESTTAMSLVEDLKALGDVEYLTVHINSYGGSVADGLAIYNALKRHPAAVTVQVDGVAVSIASLIAMAGDTVVMPANTLMMIHAPWGVAIGNARDLRLQAEMLDKYAEAMAQSYAEKTGREATDIVDSLLDGDDHWFTAAEAVDEGLADREDEEVAVAASLDTNRFTPPAAVAAIIDKQEEATMPKPTQGPASHGHTNEPQGANQTPEPNVAHLEAAAQRKAIEETKARNETIRANFRPFLDRDEVRALYDDLIVDPDVTAEAAGQKLLAKLAEGAEPASPQAHAPRIEAGQSEQEKFRVGASSALMARAGIQKDEGDNNFRGYTLLEMARASLRASGVEASSMDKREVVAASFTHTSSDFPALLENIAQRAMLRGYDEAEETFQQWTSVGELSDFKEAARTDLDMFPSLQKVAEGAEYKYATMGDRGEKVQLATYGRLFSITRQMIINDDLNAFTRVPMKMGRAAIRTIGDLVYAILNDNPTMADGTALFHADHNNLLTGAGPTTSSVDAMRVAMGKQKLGDAHLNIRPAYFVMPLELEGAMRVVMNSEFEVGASSKNNTVPNSVRGIAEVISDARLTGGANPAWYGAANPMMHDTIEVQYLDGNSQPYLEQQEGWNVDGVEMKVRIDAGVKALDFRTLAKNPGS